jgi:hypothetical protein
MKRILIINGHPDAGHPHFCDALAYASHTDAHWIICHVNDEYLALREGAASRYLGSCFQ